MSSEGGSGQTLIKVWESSRVKGLALAGVAQWIEQSQLGHMPGLWARSPTGGMQEATN